MSTLRVVVQINDLPVIGIHRDVDGRRLKSHPDGAVAALRSEVETLVLDLLESETLDERLSKALQALL